MCGIAGIFSFNEPVSDQRSLLENALIKMHRRGPDSKGMFFHKNVSLGHARLSIIDITDAAAQPFTDSTGRYTIAFNGEVFNFIELRDDLIKKGYSFRSKSDTEVILTLYIHEGSTFLNKLNGFFALAIYDSAKQTLFAARDRMGIKPFYYIQNESGFYFASELKALRELYASLKIDYASVFSYFQLNYIPGNDTIFEECKRLEPGHYALITAKGASIDRYYSLPDPSVESTSKLSYSEAQEKLLQLIDSSVQYRLISDVPLGAFLSGGIDSSVIVAMASNHTKLLNTFSIGYRDEPLFDETKYAELVAKKFNTNHTTFSLCNDDIFNILFDVLDYTDEPFADSSALAVYILSKQTRNKVTVALSGDGADEMFAGYNKHKAEYLFRNQGVKEKLVKKLKPLWSNLPKSRNNSISNTIRQLNKFANLSGKNEQERYWQLCCISHENDVTRLLLNPNNSDQIKSRKEFLLKQITNNGTFNQVLHTDLRMVLPNDMLTKVDLMSMANSLEVRTPFLDYRIVDFAASIPAEYKIDVHGRKKILRDAFRTVLPAELYDRPKHGFEVPLLKWMRNELKSFIFDDLLNKDFVQSQGIFNFEEIEKIKHKLFSSNPEDTPARLWALTVFQYWWKKYNC